MENNIWEKAQRLAGQEQKRVSLEHIFLAIAGQDAPHAKRAAFSPIAHILKDQYKNVEAKKLRKIVLQLMTEQRGQMTQIDSKASVDIEYNMLYDILATMDRHDFSCLEPQSDLTSDHLYTDLKKAYLRLEYAYRKSFGEFPKDCV